MDKKDKIIEVATRLFAENGFEKTPISAICEEAEISKGLVFHHFKNKNELLREVFISITNLINEADKVDENFANSDGRMKAFIDSVFDAMTVPKYRSIYRFNFSVIVQPTTRAVLLDLIEERFNGLQTSTEEVFHSLSYENPTIAAKMFIAEIDGIAMNYLLYDDFPIEEVKREFIKKYS